MRMHPAPGFISVRLILLCLLLFQFLYFTVSFMSAGQRMDFRNATTPKPSKSQKQEKQKFCSKEPPNIEQILKLNADPLPETPLSELEERQMCVGADAKRCIPPMRRIESDFQYIWLMESAKTLLCTIPKNFSTMLTAIMCLLNDELGFFYESKTLFGNFYGLQCSKKRLQTVEPPEELLNSTQPMDWARLSVVRDPVDRFLSGFIFACVNGVNFPSNCTRYCFGCGANLTCFMERQYDEFMKLGRGEKRQVDFLEHHLYPQSWRCEMDKHLADYTFLRYDSDSNRMIGQVVEFLQSRNVSDRALKWIKKAAVTERTPHSTVNSVFRKFFEKRLRKSAYLMELLNRMYYYDFKLFNYEIPKLNRDDI